MKKLCLLRMFPLSVNSIASLPVISTSEMLKSVYHKQHISSNKEYNNQNGSHLCNDG
ncbi:hypothetical protein [Mucilaginibacter sp. OK268]|uniref:hypothetical protein n=1 Tax=Mucilaginibacter sp. OK268 TaxID=1881048 RepID=UPI0015A21AD1|nr:hypothetical protein [Mucilaginibacter sp. OK268]